MKGLLIIGAGGHGKVVADAAAELGQWARIAFLDDCYPSLSALMDWPVVGTDADLQRFPPDDWDLAVAVGDNTVRLRLLRQFADNGYHLPSVAHPSASVSRRCSLGAGSVVLAGAVVNIAAELGMGVIVNTSATVDHDCRVGDGVHVSPGAHLGGGVVVGERSWIGIGAAVRHGIHIGADVLVGAGAAVVADVPAGLVVAGVPAKAIKRNE